MKFLLIILMIGNLHAKCKMSQHMEVVGKFVKDQSPKGSSIGIKPLEDSFYSYTADLEDSYGMVQENGILLVKEEKGKCVVERRQHQSQTHSKGLLTRPTSK